MILSCRHKWLFALKVAESYSDKNKRDNLHTFKPYGTIVYDDRILTIKSIDTVSILTLDGKFYSGAKVKNLRKRNFKMRQKLQAKGTKSAKRLLKRRRCKESRFATDVNHCISKKLVEVAKGTQRAIVLEDLKGIRKRERKDTRKTVCKTMRQALSNWSFYQLRRFIEYKAKAAGVQVIFVDPRNTSRTCSKCGHIDKKSRKDQEHFVCSACGHALNADINAALNIARRGADVIQPNAVA